MAYIEIPEEKMVMTAKETALRPRVFSSKRRRRYSGREPAGWCWVEASGGGACLCHGVVHREHIRRHSLRLRSRTDLRRCWQCSWALPHEFSLEYILRTSYDQNVTLSLNPAATASPRCELAPRSA